MFFRTKLFIVALNLELFQFAEQICSFGTEDWTPTDWYSMKLYYCNIEGADVTDLNETYEINTKANTKTNAEVNFFQYKAKNENTVDFIPNSIFDIFANLEVLLIGKNQSLKIIKPQYLKNATELKLLIIFGNQVTYLDENLFVEAKNLEYIDFRYNKIESIHKKTFSGLQKLQVLLLKGNLIKNIHFESFSHLINLKLLDLLQNQCIDHRFFTNYQNLWMKNIESKIESYCTYYLDYIQFFKTIELLDTKIMTITKENTDAITKIQKNPIINKENTRNMQTNTNANMDIKKIKESFQEIQRNFEDIQKYSTQLMVGLFIVLVCVFLNAIVIMVFVIRNVH